MITRAIAGEYAIRCNYFSENSRNHEIRTLLPLAILHDGSQWMFRAYDRSEEKSEKFKNFHFSRAINVIEEFKGKEYKRLDHEGLGNDKSWNLRLPLILKLHSSLSEDSKSQIKRDFGIPQEKDELYTSEREAFLWITKKKWYIDDRNLEQIELEYKSGIKRFYKFQLMNIEMIEKLKKYIC
jgi:predicted DNA-binding transcriptional regulator YafY